MNSALADAVLAVHFGWVAFVVVGQIAVGVAVEIEDVVVRRDGLRLVEHGPDARAGLWAEDVERVQRLLAGLRRLLCQAAIDLAQVGRRRSVLRRCRSERGQAKPGQKKTES